MGVAVMVERLRDRATSDLIVVFLAAVIGFAVIIIILGLVVLKIVDPDENIDSSIRVIGDILTVMLGAVVGFVGGRAVGANEASDTRSTQPDPGDNE